MIRKSLLGLALIALVLTSASADPVKIDRSRARSLAKWKPQIEQYSLRHYGEKSWHLAPTCLVLHYTVSKGFPWNLVKSNSFAGETPGLAVHYVVHGKKVWEILPPDVRSRGAYGINHRAINIEMVAMDAADLATRKETLETCQQLCRDLMVTYAIDKEHVYSHEQVSKMNRRIVPEVLDLQQGAPYHKIDPGEQNMKTILKGL